ncbi:MAG: hypothetical protein AAGD25_03105 [Cyanobacteria bacterium P01_F01_bin.150]
MSNLHKSITKNRTERGILTIAHTKNKYVRQANNLAMSIRLRDPDIPIAVVSNLSHDSFDPSFTQVISWDFSDTPGLISKLSLYDMTPFDETLFIDADCLALKSLDPVFEYFKDYEFGVFGINKPQPNWFLEISRVKNEISSDEYPGFNGGIYYFKRGKLSKDTFQIAKSLIPKYKELKIASFGGFPGEEPLISLAMAKLGLRAVDDHSLDIMYAPAGMRGTLNIDVLKGHCSFEKYGKLVHPHIMHFASDDNCYEYLREDLRLRILFSNSWFIAKIQELIIEFIAINKCILVRKIPLLLLFIKSKIVKIAKIFLFSFNKIF